METTLKPQPIRLRLLSLHFPYILGGFRGRGKGVMPSQDANVALFSLLMQGVINLCSKTNKIYTQYMHFKGFSSPKKRLLPGLRPGDRPLPKKFTFVLGFQPQFLTFEG